MVFILAALLLGLLLGDWHPATAVLAVGVGVSHLSGMKLRRRVSDHLDQLEIHMTLMEERYSVKCR